MSSKSDKEKLKQIQDKCQVILSQILRDEDNKYCVDCDAKGPRWASWNLGIFLCIRCAGIHRNLGVHISKVKSVNLDSWNPEQVTCLQQMGNSRARAVFEANLPDNFRRPQTDSALEAFIRAKYEQKRYIAKEWVPLPMPKPSLEFEEEKKKPKERKPTKPGGCEVPLPLNSAPKKNGNVSSISNSESKAGDTKGKSSGTADLLGLNDPPSAATISDDPFGGFLSADTSVDVISTQLSQNAPSNDAESSKALNNQGLSDQESLFSQLGGEDLQKKQQPLSKESIMSLYGLTPNVLQQKQQQQQQQQPLQHQMIGNAGPMFAGQQQIPMFGIPGVQMPSSVYPAMPCVPNNMMGVQGPSMMTQVSQANLMGTNPFLNPANCSAIGGWYTTTNPSQPTYEQLNQQMAAIALGTPMVQQMPNPTGLNWAGQQPGQTLSNNLWQ